MVRAAVSGILSTWVKRISPIMLMLGLGTRDWEFSLMILDIVAWQAVQRKMTTTSVRTASSCLGCSVALMLIPPVLSGPGKLSIEHWLHLSQVR
jgi:uncharacterized membrane protein YphA (DoxX/SURF4 family)